MTQFVGIDLSEHNGNVNMQAIKNSGVDFVIIRSSWGHYAEDTQFRNNVAKCEAVGMPYGFYHYSYALNVDEARAEAAGVLNAIKGMHPTYPIYFDMEDADGYKSRNGIANNYTLLQDICVAFCQSLSAAKYYVGIYANLSWLNNELAGTKLDRYDKWVAQWASSCSYGKSYGMWQFTDAASISGSSARTDESYAYYDFPAIIKEKGLNGGGGAVTPPTPPTPPTSTTKYKVGTPVCTNTLATSSDGGTIYHGEWTGTITQVILGKLYPYLLNSGTGWTNDHGIDTDPNLLGGGSTTPSTTKYKVGTPICTNTLATSSDGGTVYHGEWTGTITQVIAGKAYPYLLNNGTGWTNDHGIDSDPNIPA